MRVRGNLLSFALLLLLGGKSGNNRGWSAWRFSLVREVIRQHQGVVCLYEGRPVAISIYFASALHIQKYKGFLFQFGSSHHLQKNYQDPNKLVCGGLAGSTAALFTTPFDGVKTRLQTQIPGPASQYSSVYRALREIGKHEGLKGLYRGLIRRLVMYMSQGALFLASYEFFKSVFSLELPQLNTLRIQHERTKEDDAVSSESPCPSKSSTSPVVSSQSQPWLHNWLS